MSSREPARAAVRRRRWGVVAVVVAAGAALLVVLGHQPSGGSSSSAPPSMVVAPLVHRLHHTLHPDRHGGLGEADGVVTDDTTPFADVPAVTRLDPALRAALRRAATAAADDGVEVYVNSGWRSRAYQDRLFAQAISRYGSKAAAARWVDSPDTSAHVTGQAVDLGHSDATGWLSRHGAAYGLCQIYRNEPWHYELRPDAVDHGCPPMYADPTHDPRTQR